LPWNMKSFRLTLPSKVGGLRGSVGSELSGDIWSFFISLSRGGRLNIVKMLITRAWEVD
jgi:hypothetical protein